METTFNFDNWEARCHYLGDLMTNPKGKSNLQKYNEAQDKYNKKYAEYEATENKKTKAAIKLQEDMAKLDIELERLEKIKDEPHLSTACKTRLIQVFTEVTTGRVKNVKGKFLQKGLHVEEDSLTAFSLLKGEMYRKNKDRKSNGYINGECDTYVPEEDFVGDTKSNWDIFTFDKTGIADLNKVYHWQLDGYIWLWFTGNAKLIYTLQNTPEFIMNREIKNIEYELPENQWEDAKAEVRKLHTYDDLPLERKIRIINVKRDEDRFEMIKKRIVECRKFLNNLLKLKIETNYAGSDDDDTGE